MTQPSPSIAIDATVVRYPLSGVHYAVRNQALALLRGFKKHRPTLLATDPYLRKCWRNEELPEPELPERLKKAMWRITWQQTQLPALLSREHVDLLLALSYTGPLRGKTPFILQVHDTIALRDPALCTRRNAMHMRTLMPPSMRRAQSVITPSTQVASEVMTFGRRDAKDVHVVPLGVEHVFLNPATPTDLPAEYEALKPYVLFVGNIEPKKGIDTLVSAFRHLKGAADLNLILAGQEGWKCKWLIHEIDTYDGPGRVHRLGYVKREHLPALYKHAEVYVQPSIEEGFGLPVLEALAMGTPLVHSDHPVLKETSGGFGLEFPMSDVGELASTLDNALTADGRADDAAVTFAHSRTWQTWARTMVEATHLFE